MRPVGRGVGVTARKTSPPRLSPGCLLLGNESFASTNEQEGSEIARQIIRALLDCGIRVFFVTHLFDLAHSLYPGMGDSALFLRPERREDGQRTSRLLPGEPLSTSYGPDLYWRIFGAPEPAVSSPQAGEGGSACGPQIT